MSKEKDQVVFSVSRTNENNNNPKSKKVEKFVVLHDVQKSDKLLIKKKKKKTKNKNEKEIHEDNFTIIIDSIDSNSIRNEKEPIPIENIIEEDKNKKKNNSPQSKININIINDEFNQCKFKYFIIFILAKIMSDSNIRKEKEFPFEEIDECIKKDTKLATFLKEGKSTIESFMNKKCRRLQIYHKKRRELALKRMKEDFDIQDQRRKEDLLLEKEMRLWKFEDEVEQKVLNKKLILKDDEEKELRKKNENIISLDEQYDCERNENERENGGKKKEKSNKKY